MDWIITVDPEVLTDLKKLGRPAQIRVKKYLDKLKQECDHPKERGNSYRNELHGFWKYRVGDYRIVAVIEEGEITVLAVMMISHRKNAYSNKNINELFSRSQELERKIKDD